MIKCSSCGENFKWDDSVIMMNDIIYHKDCLIIYPSKYVVYDGGEYLGELEEDDSYMAYEYIDSL